MKLPSFLRLLVPIVAILAVGCSNASAPTATSTSSTTTSTVTSRNEPRSVTGSFIPQRPGEESSNVRSVSQREAQRAYQSAGF